MANERAGKAESIYSPPRLVERLDECYFYHSMDLPKQGFVSGEWDLRAGVERYLGHVDFGGKRVLDVGTASGFLAFWMERQGAEVIGFDLSEDFSWDRLPYGGGIDPEEDASWKAHIRKTNNSFWFTHALLDSKVQMVYGTVYDIPEAIGPVDVVTFGSILLHLRDPFLALQSALRITTETVVVAEALSLRAIPQTLLSSFKPFMMFLPNARRASPRDTWWYLPPRTVVEFLRILGFQHTRVNYHIQRYRGVPLNRAPVYTVVGRRTSQLKV
jgi:SAM-dependent methyltransferase